MNRSRLSCPRVACGLLPQVVLLAGVLWCGRAGEAPRDIPEIADLDPGLPPVRAMIERYRSDRAGLDHVWGIQGVSETEERQQTFRAGWRQRLEEVDFDALDAAGRVDWILFHQQLEFEAAELHRARERIAAMAGLLPFDAALAGLDQALRRMQFVDGQAAAGQLDALARQARDAKEAVAARLKHADSETPVPRTLAWRAVRRIGELRRYLADWRGFYEGYDPLFTWWARQPADALDAALHDYATFLREEVAGVEPGEDDPVIGDPIGEAALLAALRREFIAYTPQELITIAEREFAWCEAERRRAATEMGFDGDWQRALEHVKSLHVAPGDQPGLIYRLANEAIGFLESRDLLTIPPLAKESWRMDMMTPARQRVNPYFTGGETISVSFPTDTMSHADKLMSLRGNNVHFCRATVHHELIPGHHLQMFMAARYQPHRLLFETPFLLEGWCLYWEMRLWDLGFAHGPEDRTGMLFWRTHRCARIIFSLKFHLEQMTAQEAIDFLVERVGHERNNATAEVRRSVGSEYSPLYQAAYMLGGLQLRALQRELVEQGPMTEREFHDAVLRENTIPVELIRARLKGETLTRDFTADWRFYPGIEPATEDTATAEAAPE